MARRPTNPADLSRQTEVLIHQGRFEEARQAGIRLIQLRPDNPTAITLLATAELCLGRAGDALRRLQPAAQRNPDSAPLHRTLGSACRAEGRIDEALSAMEEALRLDPSDRAARCALTDLFVLKGDGDRAMGALQPIIDSGQWDANAALAFALTCESLGREADAIEPITSVLRGPAVPPPQRIQLLYRLGALFDKVGQHDKAFAAIDAANRAQPVPYDPDAMDRAVDETIASWTPDALAEIARSTETSDRPVLIVGMPRSGTSLVEQILASHPDVFGGDERGLLTQIAAELDPPDPGTLPIVRSPQRIRRQTVPRLARRYHKMLREIADDEPRVTDKMPTNLLHLGLTWAILPGARIIHCRRDPMDACLSCYFQNFSPSVSFSFNLQHLGRFHRAADRLMDHWNSVLDTPILEIAYEDLVDDQDAAARRMIEFLDLPWDDACLRFHETERIQMTSSNQQVRKPIYRSSLRRHDRYENYLAPLRAALKG